MSVNQSITTYVVLVVLLAGCGGGNGSSPADAGFGADVVLDGAPDSNPDTSPDSAPDADSAGEPVPWQSCPLNYGETGSEAECAEVRVPLRWQEPDGPTIPLFLQRLVASQKPVTAHVWLLQGGPGAASDGWAPFMDRTSKLDPTIAFYTLDHRGVGRSQRLGCPDQEDPASEYGNAITSDEWPPCLDHLTAEWDNDLAEFSSEAAARDVAAVIARTRQPGVPVILYGGSYGTTWGHRFLQLFPDEVDGVVLDSMNWPDRTYDDYDALWNEVAKRWFALCGSDATCGAKLGPDPWATLATLEDDLDKGHCLLLGLKADSLKAMLAWLIAYHTTRPFAAPLVYRLKRCAAADRTAIIHLYETIFGPDGMLNLPDNELFSQVLSHNILMSEMTWTDASSLSLEELKQIAADCLVCLGAGPSGRVEGLKWSRYPLRDELKQWAQTSTPMLMMTGGLDPFAPSFRLEQAGAPDHFTAPNQHFITFPFASHGVINNTALQSGDETCGMQLFLQFVRKPKGALDVSCQNNVAPPDFTSSNIAEQILGTSDLWENPGG